jgi:hypothetical protein
VLLGSILAIGGCADSGEYDTMEAMIRRLLADGT